eukprot:5185948-Lingulodinium_polyedra.AAC.1
MVCSLLLFFRPGEPTLASAGFCRGPCRGTATPARACSTPWPSGALCGVAGGVASGVAKGV